MKQKILTILLVLIIIIIFSLAYNHSDNDLEGYSVSEAGTITNLKLGISFKKPTNWQVEYRQEDDMLEVFSNPEEREMAFEECPSMKKGCWFLIETNNEQEETKEFLFDIQKALMLEKRPEIIEGINQMYEIINISGFESIKELFLEEQEVGSLYLVSVPTPKINYVFRYFIDYEQDCGKQIEEILETIKIN
jgi:hypothetical protein